MDRNIDKELNRILGTMKGIVFGIGGVSRFLVLPKEAQPATLLPGAKSVISVAISIPSTVYDWELRCQKEEQKELGRAVYHAAVQTASEKLDQYMYEIAAFLTDNGYQALWMPTILKSESLTPEEKAKPWTIHGLLPHVFAGYACGVGSVGMNHLLLTPKYGPRIRLNSLITDAMLPELPISKDLCIRCERCIKACPARAFQRKIDDAGKRVSQYSSEACWKSRILYHTNLHCDFGERCAAVCPIGKGPLPESAKRTLVSHYE